MQFALMTQLVTQDEDATVSQLLPLIRQPLQSSSVPPQPMATHQQQRRRQEKNKQKRSATSSSRSPPPKKKRQEKPAKIKITTRRNTIHDVNRRESPSQRSSDRRVPQSDQICWGAIRF